MINKVHNNQEVIQYWWFVTWDQPFGIVFTIDIITKERKLYIGGHIPAKLSGDFDYDEAYSINYIIDWGTKFVEEQAIRELETILNTFKSYGKENDPVAKHMSELGKKSARKRKETTDYSALAKKRWDKKTS